MNVPRILVDAMKTLNVPIVMALTVVIVNRGLPEMERFVKVQYLYRKSARS